MEQIRAVVDRHFCETILSIDAFQISRFIEDYSISYDVNTIFNARKIHNKHHNSQSPFFFEKINVEKESIREKKVGERNKEGGVKR